MMSTKTTESLTKTEQTLMAALADGKIHTATALADDIDSWAVEPADVVRRLVYLIRKKLGKHAIVNHVKRGYSRGSNVRCPTCNQTI